MCSSSCIWIVKRPVNNGAITSYHHMVALALTETLKNIKHNIKPGVQTV